MSIAGGFSQTAEKTGAEYGCNAMQIFTKSPRSRTVKPIDPADAENFKKLCQHYEIKHIITHSSYLLNFGKPLSEVPWALRDLTLDFERLHTLGGHGIVVHIGKSLDANRTEAIQNVAENAKKILEHTQNTPLDYILENTAGQGSEIGFRLDELALVWKQLRSHSPRIKSCLDTAHIWAAGYDIGSESSVKKFLQEYNEAIGLSTLACIHFNDSKKELGSRVDRHANLGDGFIPLEGLVSLAKFAMQNQVPLILETPEKDGKTHLQDIEKLRELLKS
jgi:deoxyribonuclease-4